MSTDFGICRFWLLRRTNLCCWRREGPLCVICMMCSIFFSLCHSRFVLYLFRCLYCRRCHNYGLSVPTFCGVSQRNLLSLCRTVMCPERDLLPNCCSPFLHPDSIKKWNGPFPSKIWTLSARSHQSSVLIVAIFVLFISRSFGSSIAFF